MKNLNPTNLIKTRTHKLDNMFIKWATFQVPTTARCENWGWKFTVKKVKIYSDSTGQRISTETHYTNDVENFEIEGVAVNSKSSGDVTSNFFKNYKKVLNNIK